MTATDGGVPGRDKLSYRTLSDQREAVRSILFMPTVIMMYIPVNITIITTMVPTAVLNVGILVPWE